MPAAESTKVRVRFAPSPTGFLHVGGLRTALYNYLFAKQRGGVFVLRIEDTDQKRFVPGSTEDIIRTLEVFGLHPDEGPRLRQAGDELRAHASTHYADLVESGECGPYIQSERLHIYREYAEELVRNGKAYHCFCTTERLEQVRKEQVIQKIGQKYDKYCLSLSREAMEAHMAAGTPSVIRLNVMRERGDIVFDDLVRGRVSIHASDIDDQVLMKSDGFPTYHLANVIDDHLMEITHVIRAEEWLPSTPKHLLLYEAFGWTPPAFAHLPLLLNPDKSKLSKRQGDVAVEEYLNKGYLPEALLNFIALLGWNPGQGKTQEIFSLSELIRTFDIERVHKAGAVFDLKKLDWMNADYLKQLTPDEFLEKARPFLVGKTTSGQTDLEFWKRLLTVERERLVKLSDIGVNNPFFFVDPAYDTELLSWKGNPKEMTREALVKALDVLEKLDATVWVKRKLLEEILLEAAGEKRGDFLWPLRVALTGAEKSPSPSDCAWVLGREMSLRRLRSAIERLIRAKD